jgi:SAM-dependent methyltransferase
MGYRLRSLLGSEYVRVCLFRLRYFYYVTICNRLRTMTSKDAFGNTVQHNVKQVSDWSPRMELLIRPLSVIESLPRTAKILVIGPRNEYDLILLAGLGFGFRNVRGLDLISYSPRIDLGDMHNMPYPDNTWDAVVCGWTLSYSASPQKAAAEILRVVRDQGFISMGVEYSTMTELDEIAIAGYAIHERTRLAQRVNSAEQLLELFQPNVKDVFFRHDAPLKMSHTAKLASFVSGVAVIFSVTKDVK